MSHTTESTQDVERTSSCPSIQVQDEKSAPQITSDTEKSTVGDEKNDHPAGVQLWLIILTLSSLLVLGGLDTNIVATAVPR